MNPNRWILNETTKWTSLLKKLRDEGKTNEQFEVMLNNLSLEELIAAKLEISCKTTKSPLYGLPIWNHLHELVEDAVIKFAVSVTQSPHEASSFLGMTPYKLYRLIKKYKMYNYFIPNYREKMRKEKENAKQQKAIEQQGIQGSS